jgi:nitrite reductase/ring-hydroxylating ferredoxin subunit
MTLARENEDIGWRIESHDFRSSILHPRRLFLDASAEAVCEKELHADDDYMDCFRTGPDTIGRIHAGFGIRRRAEDLNGPGRSDWREDFTLYRGESGRRSRRFRCPHRQSTLSVGWVEQDCIRCRFHGWKFDGSGQCVEQPAEKDAFTEKVRIRSCPTEEYLGLIFVYFGEGDAPSLPRYPDFEKEGLWVETLSAPAISHNIEISGAYSFHPQGI